MDFGSWLRGYLPPFLLLALGYWAAGWLGLQWAVVPGAGTALWPAAGIAFAGLMLGGLRLWPAIVVGRVLTALSIGAPMPLWATLGIAVCTMLGGLIPAWLLLRWGRFDPALERMRDVVLLAGVGGVGGAIVSASLGIVFLWASGTPAAMLFQAWLNWSLGFAVGILVVAPVLLAWWPRRMRTMGGGGWAHLLAILIVTGGLAGLVFLNGDPASLRVWHLFPTLVWAAIAFQVRGVALALAIVSVLAVLGAASGSGPLALTSMARFDILFLTQQFIAIAGLTMLILGAAFSELHGKEAQARLAAIVSSSPDAMMSCDTRGVIRSWNAGAEHLFGWRADEAIGRHFGFLVPEGEASVFDQAVRGENKEVEAVRLTKDGRLVDVSISAGQMRARGGEVLGVAAVMRDVTARRQAETYQRLLINELNHRVKNTLAIIQAIVQQSFGGGRAAAGAMATFEGRLMALSAAHDVLTRENWDAAAIGRIVEDAVAPHGGEDPRRFRISGPDLRLPPKTAVSLALALHELATNAVKYGALSNGAGHVAIAWSDGERAGTPWLSFRWSEHDGPPVTPPAKRGFGTRLIERSLAAEFEGEVAMEFRPEGLVCIVEAPLPKAGE